MILMVGGTGRCGTSISRTLLSKHPLMAALPFEQRFILDPDGIVDYYVGSRAWTPYMADKRLKRLERLLMELSERHHYHLGGLLMKLGSRILSPARYHGWELDKHIPNFKARSKMLIRELRAFSYNACWWGIEGYTHRPQVYHAPYRERLAEILGNFVRDITQELLDRHNAHIMVEDTTWNILLAPQILEILPESKFLHVYRDPRDVVASFLTQRWCPSDLVEAAIWYRDMMERWFEVRGQLRPSCYYEYKLENLVEDTERTARSMCYFAGVTYDPVLLETDLGHAHTGRWERDFNLQEQHRLEGIIGYLVEELGYA
jgi:hypothetical protein